MYYTLSQIGGRWKISILAVLLDHKELRYSEIKARVPGITERMLIKQLKELVVDKLIDRIDYKEVPPKVAYKLSPLGVSLNKILIEMKRWGEANGNG